MCIDCVVPRRARTAGVSGVPSPRQAVPVTDDLAIYPRSTWAGDSRPALGELYPEEVRFLLVHHTAGRSEYTEDGAIEEMQGVYSFHTGPEKGWPDVCYNFFIDRFGRVFEARSGSLDGPVLADATGGNQGFSQLVCLLGDFTEAMPSPEAIDALARTLTWLADRHRLPIGADVTTSFVSRGSNRWPEGVEVTTNTIAGHRDMSQTACPGDAFYPYVTSTLRTDVGARVGAVAPSTVPTSTGAASATTSAATPPSVADAALPPTASDLATATTIGPGSSTVSTATGSGVSGSGGSGPEGMSSLVFGGVLGAGIAGAAAGLVWVLKRRMENQSAER